ncbi:Kelch repeat-containing protein 3 [Grifola frondosa]|uniref:Kelch repeat-containing protein 3 n=1 Tax=Grifola frondosa TaxID=5627 RepID=A0A1C7LLM6_GRIFR|nr:Kelch repeat-containing protein 3 [Grifola frondosa]
MGAAEEVIHVVRSLPAVGCTMALWSAKNMGVLFGGVTDEDTNEETLDSVFHNDLFGYQITGNGRWISMMLKRPKKKGGGAGKKKKLAVPATPAPREDSEDDEDNYPDSGEEKMAMSPTKSKVTPASPVKTAEVPPDPEIDPDDPNLTIPMPRYNAMLAILRNTLYIYGGIFERGSREYTLDDFYSLQLDKLDRYTCLKSSEVAISAEGDESSSDGDDEEEDEDEEDSDDNDSLRTPTDIPGTPTKNLNDKKEADEEEVPGEVDQDELRSKATAFMGVAKALLDLPKTSSALPYPEKPLRWEYWAQKAHGTSDNRGKMLRRDGFTMAEERYAAYKPILEEVERILAEAGQRCLARTPQYDFLKPVQGCELSDSSSIFNGLHSGWIVREHRLLFEFFIDHVPLEDTISFCSEGSAHSACVCIRWAVGSKFSERMGTMAALYAERGYTCMEIDLPHLGEKTTSEALMHHFEFELTSHIRLCAIPFAPVIIARSSGTLIAQTYISSHPASAMLLISPPASNSSVSSLLPTPLREFDFEPRFPAASFALRTKRWSSKQITALAGS